MLTLADGSEIASASSQTNADDGDPFHACWVFNDATGFEVVEAAHGERARIHACRANASTRLLAAEPAYLGSDSMARKIAETSLTWPVALEVAAAAMYPKGELRTPPA
ncbi:MAG: hypothetical protein RLZZ15_1070 [Verrucomicrobiota bacterium]